MSIPDVINGLFESLGGLMVFLHCRAVLKDKAVKGVSIPATVFFFSWGIWNLYFYPSLHPWWSFTGGLVIVTGNLFYVALLLKYRKNT